VAFNQLFHNRGYDYNTVAAAKIQLNGKLAIVCFYVFRFLRLLFSRDDLEEFHETMVMF